MQLFTPAHYILAGGLSLIAKAAQQTSKHFVYHYYEYYSWFGNDNSNLGRIKVYYICMLEESKCITY